ncbi:hypothetical protein GHK86_12375, partial [Acidimicrobiaceae bacterium USS-CC1]|nr:hypothetical protein [Acidiferrimicrobium australe]
MLVGAGLSQTWSHHRAHRFFSHATWSIQQVSAVLAGAGRTAGRHLLLQAGAGLVVGSGVTSWVLDDQDLAQRVRDSASIAHALAGIDRHLHPVYDHHPSLSEPLLWAA